MNVLTNYSLQARGGILFVDEAYQLTQAMLTLTLTLALTLTLTLTPT